MHKQGHTQTAIATAISKYKSTISRELRRNCDQRSRCYRSDLAQRKCGQRLRGKPKKIRFTHAVRQYVEELICLKYSPESIVGTDKKDPQAIRFSPYPSFRFSERSGAIPESAKREMPALCLL